MISHDLCNLDFLVKGKEDENEAYQRKFVKPAIRAREQRGQRGGGAENKGLDCVIDFLQVATHCKKVMAYYHLHVSTVTKFLICFKHRNT